ncbi:MAG: methyltransferase domain-containing protein [Methylophilaceae bacterium]|nr:methyltransferase domain-containing protein [Methylophilaceae bacterium]
MRPIITYQKAQRLLGAFLRNRRFQAKAKNLKKRRLLELGCGPNPKKEFVNLDYRWRPGVDIVWDLLKPLPFPDHRFAGIFTEHCLEHFDLNQLERIVSEVYRILQPSGVVRIIVPDLALYVKAYSNRKSGQTGDNIENLGTSLAINRVFYSGHDWMSVSRWINDGHHFIHDFDSLSGILKKTGFSEIEQCSFGQGKYEALLVDSPDRVWESLYVEAVK